jgi:hypothetical protein
MRLARFGTVRLAAAIALLPAWGGVHAQEAFAEITATATVIPPPIEISESDLNFGSLLPGDVIDIRGADFRGWSAEGRWPGRLTIENLHGGGSFSVKFTVTQPLTNANETATLDIIWDSDEHAGAYIERTAGQTAGATDPSGYYSWTPRNGIAEVLFTTQSTGQGSPTNPTVNATLYIGGRVAWTGDEPPGVYTGSIKAEVGFLDQ